MHIAVCSQQDVVQQFNVHPSTINQRLSRFRVTRQVNARRRRRRQLKTEVRQDRCIVTTSRRNRLVSACKVVNELHLPFGVRRIDQSIKNRLLQVVNIRVRRPRVAVHLTQRHRQTHVAWATTRQHWILILFNKEIHKKLRYDLLIFGNIGHT
jgi:transposase